MNNNRKKFSVCFLRFITICIFAILLQFALAATAQAAEGEMDGSGTETDPYIIMDANDLPEDIAEQVFYALGQDITLEEGQQIDTVEGTLDGRGYEITLSDKPLIDTNLGLVENLGIRSDETIKLDEYEGPLVVNQSGTIRSCYSKVSLNYTNKYDDIGGLVGKIYGGSISNCYVAGSSLTSCIGGIAGYCVSPASGTSVDHCYYSLNTKYGPLKTLKGISATDCKKVTDTEMADGSVTALLNENLDSDEDYVWKTEDGLPVLEKVTTSVESSIAKLRKSELENLLSFYQFDADDYEESGYASYKEMYESASALLSQDSISEEEYETARENLENAVSKLSRVRKTEAVAPPEDGSQIRYINSAEDLSKISSADKSSYYRLADDLVISADYMAPEIEINCVLDGNGHKITFENGRYIPFSKVGDSGVVQNISFEGSIKTNSSYKRGPLGTEISGSVINCSSSVSGTCTSGFAKMLTGGTLANCYSISSGCSVFFEGNTLTEEQAKTMTPNYGTMRHCWYQDGLTASDLSGVDIDNASGAMSEDDMKTLDFVARMNENRGDYGVEWGQSIYGYPYFGENQAYDPDGLPLSENTYDITFTSSKTGETTTLTSQKLYVSPDEIDGYRSVGDLGLVGVAEDSSITWAVSEDSPSQMIMTGEDTGGRITVFGEGKAVLTATEHKADGTSQEVAYLRVISKRKTVEDIKLFVNDQDVTNASCSVSGSEWFTIKAKLKYEDSEEYVDAATGACTFVSEDEDKVSNLSESSGEFSFNKAGTASITVSSKYTDGVSASVQVTSEYVPVESISLSIPEEITLHGRNANSDGGTAFLPNYSSVVVTPSNASNGKNVSITSSDESIGAYVKSMVRGYVPYKAGKVTYTATVEDENPKGDIETVTGEKTVTYSYKNPVSEISMEKTDLEVTAEEKTALPLTIKGSCSDEGYEVTEPGMTFTYSKSGIVSISQDASSWKRDTSDPDNNMYLPASTYTVKGLKNGTVTVTATPVDESYEGEPVTFTVTVTGGEESADDTDEILAKHVKIGSTYVHSALEKSGASYGSEWTLYLVNLLDGDVSSEEKESYVASVKETASSWTEKEKPTNIEKTVIVLSALGQDVTDVGGKNLAEMIYNHPSLDAGSNELLYALLALDAADITTPENALWNREKIIETLIQNFQNDDGGFSLYEDSSSDVDLTGMALQALARYQYSDDKAYKAIKEGLTYLKNNLSDSFGYQSSESDAQVLIALAALNIDVTEEENGFGNLSCNLLTDLEGYLDSTGTGYKHVSSGSINSLASVQATEAFVAYQRYREGKACFWEVKGRRTELKLDGSEMTDEEIQEAKEKYENGEEADTGDGNNTDSQTSSESDGGQVSKKKSQKIRTAFTKRTYKRSKFRKKSHKIKLKTKVYGKAKVSYKSYSKYIRVSTKGVVTIKKGIKKGSYKIKITAKSTSAYYAKTKIVKIVIKK